jgi:hypothetical protein
MAERGKNGPDFGPLEIRAGGVGRLLLASVVLSLSQVRMAVFGDGVFAVLGKAVCGLFALLLLAVVIRHVRWRRKGCLVRVDDAGITLAGEPTVGWGDVSEVREVRKGQIIGLVVIPRDGVTLPVLHITLFTLRPGTLAARTARRWGSPLVLFPRVLDVSRTEIVDAVRRFSSGVPILDERREIVVS